MRRLKFFGYKNILTISKKKLDLRNQNLVKNFFRKNKPDAVINAAATVGGIYANNTYGANFIYNNLAIQMNIIHSSYLNKVKNLIFLGSSCVYPKKCNQPIKEEYLLNGELEKTNEPYAIAKITGIKMCESYNAQYGTNYKCLMPPNTYGPNDNYDLLKSHFYPALISKVHYAKINKKKSILLWGNGRAKRELMYVDDVADACVFLMEKKVHGGVYNIGTGADITIKELAKVISSVIGYKGKFKFNTDMPDGTPRKLLNVDKITNLGWVSKTSLKSGIEKTYEEFLEINKNK